MKRFKYLFLSHSLNSKTPSYGNRDNFIVSSNYSFEKGGTAQTSKWIFSNNHIGSHIDFPSHFFPEGKTISDYSPEFWFFSKVAVIHHKCNEAILIGTEIFEINKIDPKIELLLIKTDYQQFRNDNKYWEHNPGLSIELGIYLKSKFKRLRAVGFDFISTTSFQHRSIGKEVHKLFLGGNEPILLIEDMSLNEITEFDRIGKVIISPLIVENTDGSPVTVFAQIIV